MANQQYYGIENLSLTTEQKGTLVNLLKDIGSKNPNPDERNHLKTRPDGEAVIFQGKFNDEDWTIQNMKNRLGSIFGIDPSIINHVFVQNAYGDLITFSVGGTDRFRMIAFGGVFASLDESRASVFQYLKDFSADWGEA